MVRFAARLTGFSTTVRVGGIRNVMSDYTSRVELQGQPHRPKIFPWDALLSMQEI
jgi:hypothetical protein